MPPCFDTAHKPGLLSIVGVAVPGRLSTYRRRGARQDCGIGRNVIPNLIGNPEATTFKGAAFLDSRLRGNDKANTTINVARTPEDRAYARKFVL